MDELESYFDLRTADDHQELKAGTIIIAPHLICLFLVFFDVATPTSGVRESAARWKQLEILTGLQVNERKPG